MTVCAIKVCRNYKGRLKTTKHITYHRIPNNPVIRNRWIDCIRKSCGEATWKPSKTTVVCSDHFRSKDMYTVNKTGRRRLRKEAVPSKALFLSSIKSSESEDSDDIEIAEKSNPNEAAPSDMYNDVCSSTETPETLFIVNNIDVVPNNDIPDENINNKIVEVLIKTETDDEKSFSNLDPIYDSPTEEKLRGTMSVMVPNNDIPNEKNNDKTAEVQIKTETDKEKLFSDLDPIYASPTEKKLRGTMSIMVPNNDIPNEKISDKTVEVQNKTETDDEKSFSSDLDSVYDSPTEVKLRRHLRRKLRLEKKHLLTIKSLRLKNQRLMKKISSLKQIIGEMKREQYR